jgi:hypothetical protein
VRHDRIDPMLPSSRPVRRSTVLAASAIALLLGACATPVPKYVAAGSGPRAQLVMRGNVLPGEAYGVYLFQDALHCTGLRQVGIGVTNRDPETTAITPGLSTGEVLLTKPNKTVCRVRWSFEPVAGRKYLVSTTSTPTGCTARVLDATDPHRIVAEGSLRRRDVGGKMCVPLAQTTTMAEAESRAQAAGEADLPIVAPPPRARTEGLPPVSDDDLRDLKGR